MGHPSRRTGRLLRATAAPARALGIVLVVAVLAGCGPAATPSPSASAGATESPGPKPTSWPFGIPSAVIALGAMDNELPKAGADLIAAAEAEDFGKMRGAADGLVNLIDGNLPNAKTLQTYEFTRKLGADLEAALLAIRDGAARVRDGITAGDAEAIVDGSRGIASGLEAYGELRFPLSELIPEAMRQRRALVK